MTYRKSTRQTMRVSVAGIDVQADVTWTDGDESLALKIISALHTAVNGPAAESYAHVGPWDITTVTTERSRDAALPDSPVLRLEFAGRNLDLEEGA